LEAIFIIGCLVNYVNINSFNKFEFEISSTLKKVICSFSHESVALENLKEILINLSYLFQRSCS
jgi:hypothetical protein